MALSLTDLVCGTICLRLHAAPLAFQEDVSDLLQLWLGADFTTQYALLKMNYDLESATLEVSHIVNVNFLHPVSPNTSQNTPSSHTDENCGSHEECPATGWAPL